MSTVKEKRTFTIPPCKVDKELIREIGKIMEKESNKIREEMIERVKRKPYSQTEETAEGFVDDYFESDYLPHYVLEAKSRDIRSHEIDNFVKTKWPKDTDSISLSMGGLFLAREIEIKVKVYLESSMAKSSSVSVSGRDAIWVHGITDQIEHIFENKKLGYGPFVEHAILRGVVYCILLLLTLVVGYWVSPIVIENDLLIAAYIPLGATFMEFTFQMLYPRFEFGEEPLQKKIRKWLYTFILGSGIISTIILKAFGLS